MSRPLPDGAWDCHAHVLGEAGRYPLAAGRSYDPPRASLSAYLAFLDRAGLERGVLVQPSVYGFDNRCMLDALREAGGRLRGIAVPEPGSGPDHLRRLHQRGIRGIRCNLLNPGGLDPSIVVGWQEVMLDLGWHVEMHIDVQAVGDLRSYLERFNVPVVIDHMGRPAPGRISSSGALSPDAPSSGLSQLLALVREGACFTKLSAPYRLSGGPPPWLDVAPLARALMRANPSACLWASDWPHVDTEGPVREEDLFEALGQWCGPTHAAGPILPDPTLPDPIRSNPILPDSVLPDSVLREMMVAVPRRLYDQDPEGG